MLTKRIIPCLDIKDGRVVKGVQFKDHRDAGDPAEMASYYDLEGADEIVFYDITASAEDRNIMLDLVSIVAERVFIPLTVGGGLRTVQDIRHMLKAGADKISLNTAAVENPEIIQESSFQFGSQCIVLGLDAKRVSGSSSLQWDVRIRTGHSGGISTGIDAIDWAVKAASYGAGEIVVNSIDADGTQSGYDLELMRIISENVSVPVIASGGAGSLMDMAEVLTKGKSDAVLAASIFHFGKFSIRDVKEFLIGEGIAIRPMELK